MSQAESTIYIAEDDQSFRDSLERLIQSTGFDTVSFETAEEFLAQKAIHRPACLLLDVNLPGMDGLELQKKLIERNSHIPIIFITGYGSIPLSVKAVKQGAIDFLPKPFDAADLFASIRHAVDTDRTRFEISCLIETLTTREYEVLGWVITGALNKQIASYLGIAEKTVKIHRGQVMRKTGVNSIADLVRLAEKAGIPPAELSKT